MERAFVAVCVAMLCSAGCRGMDLTPGGEAGGGAGAGAGSGGAAGTDTGLNQPDACKIANGGCDALVSCSVVDGHVSCGACPKGYDGGGDTSCKDVDECAANSDDCDDAPDACKNDVGSYHCQCPSGFTGDGKGADGCSAADPCASGNGDCHPLATCMRSQANSVMCMCPSGYAGDGHGPNGCTNIDECAMSTCGAHRTCMDDPGSFRCGACEDGYASSSDSGPCDEFWPQRFTTGVDEEAWAVTTDSSGNVYVAGYTTGALDANTNAGGLDIMLVKYDAAGQKQWSRQIGTSGDEEAFGVTTDAGGAVYLAGYSEGALDGNSNQGGSDVVVMKLDGAGQTQWTRELGTASHDYATGIRADASGNIYVTGATDGSLDGNTSAGGGDLFVVKYDAAGQKQWTKQFGTGTDEESLGLAVDGSGNIYVTGTTDGALDENTHVGALDMIVIKVDGAGQKQWTRQLGTTADDTSTGVTTDKDGNVYLSGWTDGALDGNRSAGDTDIVVVKLDGAGQKQWTRQIGNGSYNLGLSIASDTMNNVYVTGVSDGALNDATTAGGEDLYVLKYDSMGMLQWTRQTGTVNSDYGNSIAVDEADHIYVTGSENGMFQGTETVGANNIVVKYDARGVEQ